MQSAEGLGIVQSAARSALTLHVALCLGTLHAALARHSAKALCTLHYFGALIPTALTISLTPGAACTSCVTLFFSDAV